MIGNAFEIRPAAEIVWLFFGKPKIRAIWSGMSLIWILKNFSEPESFVQRLSRNSVSIRPMLALHTEIRILMLIQRSSINGQFAEQEQKIASAANLFLGQPLRW